MTDPDPDPDSGSDPATDAADGPGFEADARDGGGDDRPEGDADDADDPLSALAGREGWRVEGYAARVHYRGEGDRYSVEYYAPSDCVLYWRVKGDGETAVPVGRGTVPGPLRERVRRDLAAAGVDPGVEERTL